MIQNVEFCNLAGEEILERLKWYYNESHSLGLCSNFPTIISVLERGGPDINPHPTTDISDKLIEELTRARMIRRALESLPDYYVRILRAAVEDCPDCPKLDSLGSLAGVMPLTYAARKSWADSNSDRSLVDWLARLVYRCSLHSSCTLEEDRKLLAQITSKASEVLNKALRSFFRQFVKISAKFDA